MSIATPRERHRHNGSTASFYYVDVANNLTRALLDPGGTFAMTGHRRKHREHATHSYGFDTTGARHAAWFCHSPARYLYLGKRSGCTHLATRPRPDGNLGVHQQPVHRNRLITQ